MCVIKDEFDHFEEKGQKIRLYEIFCQKGLIWIRIRTIQKSPGFYRIWIYNTAETVYHAGAPGIYLLDF
jgi:hypothetical protein